MHSYNKDIGSFGEALARDYLISKGYKILNMNFLSFKILSILLIFLLAISLLYVKRIIY